MPRRLGINVLGHYFFTASISQRTSCWSTQCLCCHLQMLLLPALQRSTADRGVKARVVNTSSSGHAYAPNDTGIDWTVLRSGTERDATIKKWGCSPLPGQGAQWKLYGISKLVCSTTSWEYPTLMTHSREISWFRIFLTGITVTASRLTHFIPVVLARTSSGMFFYFISNCFGS